MTKQCYKTAQPLISIHVPKTGGRSLRRVLEQWFGPQNLLHHYTDDERNQLPEKHAWRKDICIHGHFNRHRGFGVLDYYPRAAQFIIFLRDPFATSVSLYFYLKQHGGNFPFEGKSTTIDALCPTLADFIRLAADHPGSVPGMSFLQYLPEEVTESSYPEKLFDRFLHVGVTERMQPSLDLLADRLDFPRVRIPVENTSRYDEEIDPALRALHERYFPLAHEIYQKARADMSTNR